MKKLILLALSISAIGCDRLTQKINEKQAADRAVTESLTKDSNDVVAYSDCLVQAKSEDENQACEKMKENWSEANKNRLKKIQDEKKK